MYSVELVIQERLGGDRDDRTDQLEHGPGVVANLLLGVLVHAQRQEVQRVVQGLGYGLDDSAQAAAREIRFRPAQQEGHAVDSTAIVHIVFELAY